MLHGLFDHKGTWRRLWGLLEGTCRLVAPDLVGNGRSSKPRLAGRPVAYPYSLAMHCDHLEVLLERVGAHQVVLVGNSLGAGLALYLMCRRPQAARRVRGLVLIDAAAYPQAMPGYIHQMGGWPGRLFPWSVSTSLPRNRRGSRKFP